MAINYLAKNFKLHVRFQKKKSTFLRWEEQQKPQCCEYTTYSTHIWLCGYELIRTNSFAKHAHHLRFVLRWFTFALSGHLAAAAAQFAIITHYNYIIFGARSCVLNEKKNILFSFHLQYITKFADFFSRNVCSLPLIGNPPKMCNSIEIIVNYACLNRYSWLKTHWTETRR